MDPLPAVRTFLKLQEALSCIAENGICLGDLHWIGTKYAFDDDAYGGCYSENVARSDEDVADKTSQLEGQVQKLYKDFNEKNVFCCGGSVTLPDHDARSLIIKLLDGDPSKPGDSTGTSGPSTTLAASVTSMVMERVIDCRNVASFGDLREGATVVDHSVRKAWEAYFHLDFDYTWLPEIRKYLPGFSKETLQKLAQIHGSIGNQGLHASIENVDKKLIKKRRGYDEDHFDLTFKAQVVSDGSDEVATTEVTARSVKEPKEARIWSSEPELVWKCSCGGSSKKTCCPHVAETLVALVDPYGGGQFHLDHKYNKALFLRPILQHIETHLAHGVPVSLQPYKINIYGEEGFFKSHKDSTRDPKMIGTLVVCLPSEHEGGELVVSHGGVKHVFDFAPLSGDKSKLQWAAMYGDCLHEVREVKKGYRATLTFSILQDGQKRGRYDRDPPLMPDNLPSAGYKIALNGWTGDFPEVEEVFHQGPWNAVEAESKAGAVVQAIRDLDPSFSHVAIILSHDYTQESLLQPEALKGVDQALYGAVSKILDSELLTVVARNHWTMTDENGESENDGEGETTLACYAFSRQDLEWLAGSKGDLQTLDGVTKPRYAWEGAAESGKMALIVPSSVKEVLLDHHEEGFTGNEFNESGSSLDVYFQAALISHRMKERA